MQDISLALEVVHGVIGVLAVLVIVESELEEVLCSSVVAVVILSGIVATQEKISF